MTLHLLGRAGSPSRPLADDMRTKIETLPSPWPAALGRDGSPSRPFADEPTRLGRSNGGLGEPALPKAKRLTKASSKCFAPSALTLR